MPAIETRFQFIDLIKVLLMSALLYFGFLLLFSFAPGTLEWLESLHPALYGFIQYLLQFIIVFFPLWFFVVDKYSTTSEDFGFQPAKQSAFRPFLFYFIYLAVALGLGFLLKEDVANNSAITTFGLDALGIGVGGLLIIVIAPLLEEIFFRGFVYRVFTKRWPIWLASGLSAALFALAHFDLANLPTLFLFAILLNYTYEHTKSLKYCVLLHALNNIIVLALELYFLL